MSKNDTPEVQSRRLQELRTHLQQLLDALLHEPGKRPVHASEIRRRLYGYLKHMLDVDAVEPAPLPTLTTTHPNGSKEELPVDTIFEESAQETAKQINTFEGFEDWYPWP